ncbi:MAG TPA: diacylglycerol kinase family protein [Natronosporangium sp.]|nr:diacylglycerol kinase family protein [Natronosporangium sp.]
MRALLVVNPNATTTSERSRSVLVRALRSEVTLDVAYTRARGHATALATDAVAAGFGLVVAHGGDGTVNEVVNGLMAAPVTDRPALAVVPGGSTNVFARALGLPADWGEAVGAILEALRDSRGRTVGLGLADGRYFTFCAGLGIDAAVVRRVERARSHGRTSSPALYVRATAGQLLVGANRSTLTVDAPDAKDEAFAAVIVQNTAPWTYLWGRPVHLSPEASFDRGLDVVALRRARSPAVARLLARMVVGRPVPRSRQLMCWQDLDQITVRSTGPVPFQLDGEYLGEREEVRISASPSALRVLC